MPRLKIDIPQDKIKTFCQRHHIQRLAVFGSVLRDDFDSGSDVDVLVEFAPGVRIGMIRLAALEFELGDIIGRKVDMNTPGFLSPHFRQQVISTAEVQYEAA